MISWVCSILCKRCCRRGQSRSRLLCVFYLFFEHVYSNKASSNVSHQANFNGTKASNLFQIVLSVGSSRGNAAWPAMLAPLYWRKSDIPRCSITPRLPKFTLPKKHRDSFAIRMGFPSWSVIYFFLFYRSHILFFHQSCRRLTSNMCSRSYP